MNRPGSCRTRRPTKMKSRMWKKSGFLHVRKKSTFSFLFGGCRNCCSLPQRRLPQMSASVQIYSGNPGKYIHKPAYNTFNPIEIINQPGQRAGGNIINQLKVFIEDPVAGEFQLTTKLSLFEKNTINKHLTACFLNWIAPGNRNGKLRTTG